MNFFYFPIYLWNLQKYIKHFLFFKSSVYWTFHFLCNEFFTPRVFLYWIFHLFNQVFHTFNKSVSNISHLSNFSTLFLPLLLNFSSIEYFLSFLPISLPILSPPPNFHVSSMSLENPKERETSRRARKKGISRLYPLTAGKKGNGYSLPPPFTVTRIEGGLRETIVAVTNHENGRNSSGYEANVSRKKRHEKTCCFRSYTIPIHRTKLALER